MLYLLFSRGIEYFCFLFFSIINKLLLFVCFFLKKRYQGVLKNSNSGSSHTNKVDAVKEELEDIELKVEQCKVCI